MREKRRLIQGVDASGSVSSDPDEICLVTRLELERERRFVAYQIEPTLDL